jgi:hypothetical protein
VPIASTAGPIAPPKLAGVRLFMSDQPASWWITGAMRIVDLVYFHAGGGHRASALALEAPIHRAGLPFSVRLVNLREVLDSGDRLTQAHWHGPGGRLKPVRELALDPKFFGHDQLN